MKFKIDWNQKEIARAAKAVEKHRVVSRTWKVVLRLATFVLVALLAYLLFATFRDGWPGFHGLIPWIMIASGAGILYSGVHYRIWAWQTRRNNPNVTDGFLHTLSDDGYRVQCGSVDSIVGWAGVVQVVETEEFFLIYISKKQAYFLPKRVLKTAEIEEVHAKLSEHLGTRAHLLTV